MFADLKHAAEVLLRHCHEATAAPSTGSTAAASSLSLFAPVEEASARAVQLELTFMRTPVSHRVPLFLDLPHAIHKGSVCLITPAPQAKFKQQLEAKEHQQVKRVLDVEKLAAKFSEPVALRALAKSFDHFFVHHKLRAYPQALTGEFLNHSTPVWLASGGKTLADSVTATCARAVCPRRGNSTVSIVVGNTLLGAAELKENIEAAFAQLAKHLEGGLMDILSARLCATEVAGAGRRVALPVFARKFDIPAADSPAVAAAAAAAAASGGGGSTAAAAEGVPKKRARTEGVKA